MAMTANDVLDMAKNALRAAGISDSVARLVPDNLIGDDDPRCEGYVQLDGGVDIYPTLVGDDVGWGVSVTVCAPGCHTMPNGDPGYPDDYDPVDVVEPRVECNSILGKRVRPRYAHEAVREAICFLVSERMKEWSYQGEEA